VQIGITMASIGIGALGEPALASILKGALGHTLSHGVAAAVLVIVAFLIIASVQLVAGEMVPKFYAIDRAEAVARRVARPNRSPTPTSRNTAVT
jgi:CBS domain containing-hemolysin-like protein